MNRRADRILEALLSNKTIKAAAEAAKVSERVVYNYLNDPAFEIRYKNARSNIILGVSNNLRSRMNEAVEIIGQIMCDTDVNAGNRLAAAKLILEMGNRYIETVDILERLQKLEANTNK